MGPSPHPSPGHCRNDREESGSRLAQDLVPSKGVEKEGWEMWLPGETFCPGSSLKAVCLMNWQRHQPSVALLGAKRGAVRRSQEVSCLMEPPVWPCLPSKPRVS